MIYATIFVHPETWKCAEICVHRVCSDQGKILLTVIYDGIFKVGKY